MPSAVPTDDRLLAALHDRFPSLQAAYPFGSAAEGALTAESDPDLAVLIPEPVDLVDFKTASTVLQYQILSRGRQLYARDPAAVDGYEAFVLSEMTRLNERPGIPQSARDVFALLGRHGLIAAELAERLQRMVGFRSIAMHDYQKLQLPIVIAIIERHL
ncbi:MAG TPA: HepT-like ribonuclease domain-containing protein [Candidatus Competibacteraceae bacterium]|nr:HepT-like ribonuclease domain-containing protein [Candidatus Competibacteraceae bacterium]